MQSLTPLTIASHNKLWLKAQNDVTIRHYSVLTNTFLVAAQDDSFSSTASTSSYVCMGNVMSSGSSAVA